MIKEDKTMKGKSLFFILLMLLGFNVTILAAEEKGSNPKKGGNFYLKNISSNQYLKFGGSYNEKAAEGSAGTLITVEILEDKAAGEVKAPGDNKNTDLKCYIRTLAGYLNSDLDMTAEAFEWILTKADKDDGPYFLKTSDGKGVLTSNGDANGVLGLTSYNPDHTEQKWLFINKFEAKGEMALVNATPLIVAAAFDKNDNVGAWGLNADNIIAVNEDSDTAEYGVSIACGSAADSTVIAQTLPLLPKGYYKLSFEALSNTKGVAEVQVLVDHKFVSTIQTLEITQSETVDTENQAEVISSFKNNSISKHSLYFAVEEYQTDNKDYKDYKNKADVTIRIVLRGEGAIACIDNFTLYIGEKKKEEEDKGSNPTNNKNGSVFYLKNVYSGKFLKFGGANNAKAVEGDAGIPVTLTQTNGKYTIQTTDGYYLDGNLSMTGDAYEWTLTKADKDDGPYFLKANDTEVLTTQDDENKLLGLALYDAYSKQQKWTFFTENKMREANGKTYSNVTPLIKAATFDKNDNISAWGLNSSDIVAVNEDSDAAEYGAVIYCNSTTSETTISQTLEGLGQGYYKLLFSAAYNAASTATAQATIYQHVSGITTAIDIIKEETLTGENQAEMISCLDTINHRHSLDFVISEKNENITIRIMLQGEDAIACIDDFALYSAKEKPANEEVEEEPGSEQDKLEDQMNALQFEQEKKNLKSYYEQIVKKFDLLNEAGQDVYSTYKQEIENKKKAIDNFTTQEELDEARVYIDNIYEQAVKAHDDKVKQDIEDALNNGGGSGDDAEDKEVDVTDLFIKNAGFGTGNDMYWTINGAVVSVNGIPVTGATGNFLFRGISIRQDVSLLNGKYKLTAKIASTNGAVVTLIANEGKQTEQSVSLVTTTEMKEISLDKVIVYDGVLFIHVTSDVEFYTDDFSLSYQEPLPDDPQLKDTEVLDAAIDFYPTITIARTLKANTWNTVVFPFDMDIPAGWEVKTLASSTTNGENITLFFEDVESIEAGVPYMVRTAEVVSTITGRNVWLNTELKPKGTNHVTLVGVYEVGNIPEGAFFISSNKFWYAQDGTNTIKAYRAYIQPKTSNARALNYRFDGEGTTAIDDEQLTIDNEATIVAIYTLGGMRISDMQQGVNILQMSDGTTIKVVIK